MPAPFKQRYQTTQNDQEGVPREIEMTSVVIDKGDFEDLVAELRKHPPTGVGQQQWDGLVDRINQAWQLPLAKRGTKTEWLFDRFQVETDYLSIIVRGHGPRALERLLEEYGPEQVAEMMRNVTPVEEEH